MFSPRSRCSTPQKGLGTVAMVDLDGDGDRDVVSVNGYSEPPTCTKEMAPGTWRRAADSARRALTRPRSASRTWTAMAGSISYSETPRAVSCRCSWLSPCCSTCRSPRTPRARWRLRSRPIPVGTFRARFSLPRSGEAALELIDLQGRRVIARALGRLPAGPHAAECLAVPARLANGLYWLRLRQGDETTARRGGHRSLTRNAFSFARVPNGPARPTPWLPAHDELLRIEERTGLKSAKVEAGSQPPRIEARTPASSGWKRCVPHQRLDFTALEVVNGQVHDRGSRKPEANLSEGSGGIGRDHFQQNGAPLGNPAVGTARTTFPRPTIPVAGV